MRKLQILITVLLFISISTSTFAQGIINYNPKTEVYSVRKTKSIEIGIRYPYQIAYVWTYTYNFKGGIQKRREIHVGEDMNKFIPPVKPLSLMCEVTSYQRVGNFITNLVYDEYYWYPQDIDSLPFLDTINVKVKNNK